MKIEITGVHLSLFVSDPEASAVWYNDILGMVEHARGPSWIMMSFGDKHHDIALIKAQDGAHHGGLGLQHYGLEIVGDLSTLRQLYGELLDKGVDIVKVTDHEIGNGLYFNDPDGNRLEFFVQTEPSPDLANSRFKAAGAPSREISLKRL